MEKLLLAVGLVLGAGGLAYGISKGNDADARQRDLELRLAQQQYQPPIQAQPTQQGQNLAGAVASIFDGGAQLVSLFMKPN